MRLISIPRQPYYDGYELEKAAYKVKYAEYLKNVPRNKLALLNIRRVAKGQSRIVKPRAPTGYKSPFFQ